MGVVVWAVMGLWGVPFSVDARDLSAKVDSLRAAASDTTRDLSDRILVLKRAIRMDRTGVSRFELAQLYMSEGNPDDQMDAEFWLKGAIARDRKNPEFRATYARLLWQLDDIELANVQAKKALEIDPDQTCALYYAGRYAAWGMDGTIAQSRWATQMKSWFHLVCDRSVKTDFGRPSSI